ncbi:MAG: hypothetical protein QG650_707, partial [Patescibacteria group bacterium]|nr:hypothetical protein [Patescibacteria group bacterium]
MELRGIVPIEADLSWSEKRFSHIFPEVSNFKNAFFTGFLGEKTVYFPKITDYVLFMAQYFLSLLGSLLDVTDTVIYKRIAEITERERIDRNFLF